MPYVRYLFAWCIGFDYFKVNWVGGLSGFISTNLIQKKDYSCHAIPIASLRMNGMCDEGVSVLKL